MPRISEEQFATWTKPASDAEQDRYDWTREHIEAALDEHAPLAEWSFDVYAKGSYPNFTNVVRDSDVDIAVELTNPRANDFAHGAKGLGLQDFGLSRYVGPHDLAGFKDEVERALRAHFPKDAVRRGDKALKVRELTRGLAADVVACQTHFQYTNPNGRRRQGILLRSDSNPGRRLVNYPQQHHDEGLAKNEATSKRYKRVVRILKNLENKMVKEELIEPVPSFLIESAVWNVPDPYFKRYGTWTERVQAALAHIFNGTMTDACVASSDWKEANDIKFLFHSTQSWSRRDAYNFASKAWDRIGF